MPRKRTQTRRFGNDETMMDISDLESSSDTDDERGVPLSMIVMLGTVVFGIL